MRRHLALLHAARGGAAPCYAGVRLDDHGGRATRTATIPTNSTAARSTIIAVTREVGDLSRCELTYRQRQPIDTERARRQHAAYRQLLGALGAHVLALPTAPGLPDAVFVEDACIVLDECAILPHMGAPSRRAERDSLAAVLSTYRTLVWLAPPGTLDGGDVLRLGRRLYVGLSTRTDPRGIAALRRHVETLGYTVQAVPVHGCLHLKSACTAIGPQTLLVNPNWVDTTVFTDLETLAVVPAEPEAANVLHIGDTIVASASFPRTVDRLVGRGLTVRTLDNSEILKAEGGLTCTSLLFE